jgi:hypothetical protein
MREYVRQFVAACKLTDEPRAFRSQRRRGYRSRAVPSKRRRQRSADSLRQRPEWAA